MNFNSEFIVEATKQICIVKNAYVMMEQIEVW